MIIYLDVLLIENFLINFFLIIVTMQISSNKIRYKRVISSSIIGAIYTLTIFFEKLELFTNLMFKILIVIIMIKIVLDNKKKLQILIVSAIFFLVSIAFSGFCFLFAMAENPYNIAGVFTIKNYSSKILLFSSIIVYLSIHRIYVYIKERSVIKNFIYELDFCIDGKNISTKAFLDTGNELIEPVTMLPVIILERKICSYYIINEKDAFNIPYKLVNGTSSVMKGIKVKDIILKDNSLTKKNIDAIITFSDTKLSADNEYNALLSRAIL